MTDHEGDFRGFTLRSEAWYSIGDWKNREKIVDEVNFGFYSPGGGTSGEMSVSWHDLHNGAPTPKLNVYDDAWETMAHMQDVFKAMHKWDDQNITPRQFCDFLLSAGFKDNTPRSDPNKKQKRHEGPIDEVVGVLRLTLDSDTTLCESTRGALSGAISVLENKVTP